MHDWYKHYDSGSRGSQIGWLFLVMEWKFNVTGLFTIITKENVPNKLPSNSSFPANYSKSGTCTMKIKFLTGKVLPSYAGTKTSVFKPSQIIQYALSSHDFRGLIYTQKSCHTLHKGGSVHSGGTACAWPVSLEVNPSSHRSHYTPIPVDSEIQSFAPNSEFLSKTLRILVLQLWIKLNRLHPKLERNRKGFLMYPIKIWLK